MTTNEVKWWLRRLHSITGILPIGAFLIQHLMGNAFVVLGKDHYDEHVHFLLDMPFLILLEWGTIFLPLAFHALLGIVYTYKSEWNPVKYNYERNWAYVLQRVTGIVTLIFIVIHLAGTRFSFDEEQKRNMHDTMVLYFAENPGMVVLYMFGVICSAYHLCNGIWSFCIMWGLTITRKSQDALFKLCMGLCAALCVAGIASAAVFGGWIDVSGDTGKTKDQLKRDGKLSGSVDTPAKAPEWAIWSS